MSKAVCPPVRGRVCVVFQQAFSPFNGTQPRAWERVEGRGGRAKNAKSGDRESGLRETQILSVSTSFRRGWRMVRAGGGAGRPADMAKSSEWRSTFGRFCLRRGTGFAGLDGCKDCAMPVTETGESKSKAKGFPISLRGLRGFFLAPPGCDSVR
jgi:hypothetical protein